MPFEDKNENIYLREKTDFLKNKEKEDIFTFEDDKILDFWTNNASQEIQDDYNWENEKAEIEANKISFETRQELTKLYDEIMWKWTQEKMDSMTDYLFKEQKIDEEKWFKAPVKSCPAEKIWKMTYCSRTARKNLERLWIKNPVQWASARDSFNSYWKNPEQFPPTDPNATVFDLYCDASPKNRKYWHRSVWVKIDWDWFVLDPYYNKWNTSPIPADQYISMMVWKWRKIWWWHAVA